MSSEELIEIPDSGAVFTFGKSRFADNAPSYFFVRKDPIIDLNCGDEHTVIVCRNGRVFSFGRNSWGELGLSHRMAVARPNCIKCLKPRKSTHIACGRAHTLILTDEGRVFSCGNNNDGQLGLEDVVNRDSPHEINMLEDIKQLSAGSNHSAALTADGEVYMWGSNKEGQLGLGSDILFLNIPTLLTLEAKIVQVTCGYYHTLLLTENGQIYAFGEGEGGKLGVGDELRRNEPILVKSLEVFRYIAAGGNHSAAISKSGQLFMWGSNDQGQLGLKIKSYTNRPTLFNSLDDTNFTQISCGENHTAVITDKWELYTFGNNDHGKLGADKFEDTDLHQSTIPIRIKKFENYFVLKVKCGGCHTMVLAAPKVISSSYPVSLNTEKEITSSGKLSEHFDTESLSSSRSSAKPLLPPLQRFTTKSPTKIPSSNPIESTISPNQLNQPNTAFPNSDNEHTDVEQQFNNKISKDMTTNDTLVNDDLKYSNSPIIKKASSYSNYDKKVSVKKSTKSCTSLNDINNGMVKTINDRNKCAEILLDIVENPPLKNIENNEFSLPINNEIVDICNNNFEDDLFEEWHKKQYHDMKLVMGQIQRAKFSLERLLERHKLFPSEQRISFIESQDKYYYPTQSNSLLKYNKRVYRKYKKKKPPVQWTDSSDDSQNIVFNNNQRCSSIQNKINDQLEDGQDNNNNLEKYLPMEMWADIGAGGDCLKIERKPVYMLENKNEDIISGNDVENKIFENYSSKNGNDKENAEEKQAAKSYIKLKKKLQAQRKVHAMNDAHVALSHRKSKLCVIL